MAKYHILIAGQSASGKTTSLYRLAMEHQNPKSVAYLCCEAGKTPIWANRFTTLKSGLNTPHDAMNFFKKIEDNDSIEYCVLDGFNYLMNMFHDVYIHNAKDGRSGWGDYAVFIRQFFAFIGVSKKKWIIIAHNTEEVIEKGKDAGNIRYYVPIQGSVKGNGLESFFEHVIYSRIIPIANAHEMIGNGEVDPNYFYFTKNDYYDEQAEGVKGVFQTKRTADMAFSRIRSSLGTWKTNQTFINNDIWLVMQHFDQMIDEHSTTN